ncbi:nucleotidyltransferase family protein [Promicromonospora thailandica]|uniref:nucleotidyltransferase family protein n=1 Tax=Promicromonospora thailandica TaxID=765201 RepID=UPI0027E290F6|nr:nucleotidyltransferase family protein [Promicromonospora thailandica]
MPVTALGIVLAAGAGRRFGGPKALARDAGGVPWVHLACRTLHDGGCAEVVVVLGADADLARALVPEGARPVVAADWASGVAASLRTGLTAAAETRADVAVVTLVDLPGLRADAVRRVLAAAPDARTARGVLARAAYDGAPGHPVLLGRAHWAAVARSVAGDTGAGPYLRAHDAAVIDCTDVGGGRDVDEARTAT